MAPFESFGPRREVYFYRSKRRVDHDHFGLTRFQIRQAGATDLVTVLGLRPEPSRRHRDLHLRPSLAQPSTRQTPLLSQLLDRFRPNPLEELGSSETNLSSVSPPISDYNPSGKRGRRGFWQHYIESGEDLS